MRPLKQRYRHNPEAGVYGDCHRACLASVLEINPDDIPHFGDPREVPGNWDHHQRRWLIARGYVPISMMFDGSELSDVLYSLHHLNPDTYCILGGSSRNGTGHSVVVCNGEIVHDPSLDDSGIVGPMEDGRYWVTYFGHIKATALPGRTP
jgi:hypothetical protein